MLYIKNLSKSIGPKDLYMNISFQVNKQDKVGIIGRNGIGKSTLFKNIVGEDLDYVGDIEVLKGIRIIKTEQESFFDKKLITLEYILDYIPEYRNLHKIIKNYENDSSHDLIEIQKFSEAIVRFHELDYDNIEVKILETLETFGIDYEKALGEIFKLSGGEKRFVELVRIMYASPDLALIDEPTNHMDYIGKEKFLNWLNEYKKTVIIITHDRDVLNTVDKVIELKKDSARVINGNYEKYILQNSGDTVADINYYKTQLDKVEELKLLVENTKILKSKTKGVHAIMKLAKRIERYQAQYEEAKSLLVKPSFWIDQESLATQDKKNIENYDKYKAKNIKFQSIMSEPIESERYINEIISVNNVNIGYNKENILIENLNLKLKYGEIFEIRGRNGAGKSTFLKAIINTYFNNGNIPNTVLNGNITLNSKLRLGVYEQEISSNYFDHTLYEILKKYYVELDLIFNNQECSRILSNYLFDPIIDIDLKLRDCSGGQKARIQIIKMLLNNPNLIILDEPTNHLDLPSIEELENMLKSFKGTVIYVSHDNYFRKNIGGKILNIQKSGTRIYPSLN